MEGSSWAFGPEQGEMGASSHCRLRWIIKISCEIFDGIESGGEPLRVLIEAPIEADSLYTTYPAIVITMGLPLFQPR
jgi:hypothetical protein